MNLNTLFGNRGASWTISGACASGGHAVGQAAGLIAMGSQDRIICGGVQEITWQSVCSFDATNAFSIRMDDPSQACRPFDKDRDGLIPSGGAAVVALERGDIARKRGANILGWIRGYGFSSDGAEPLRSIRRRSSRLHRTLPRKRKPQSRTNRLHQRPRDLDTRRRRHGSPCDRRGVHGMRPVGIFHKVHDGTRNVDVGRGTGRLYTPHGAGLVHRAEPQTSGRPIPKCPNFGSPGRRSRTNRNGHCSIRPGSGGQIPV